MQLESTETLRFLSERYVAPSLLAWRVLECGAYEPIGRGLALDLGSGAGFFTQLVAPSAIGIDMDRRQLEMGVTLRWLAEGVCGDLRALPFRSESIPEMIA